MASSVRDIMTTEFEWIADGDSVLAGGARLIELGFGRMPVRDAAGAFLGMLTLRDVVRVVTRGDDPARVTAGDVADSGISAVDVDESLEQALARLAAAGGGRLPVVDGPKLVGMISKAEVDTYRRALAEIGPDAERLVEDISPDDQMHELGLPSYLWTGVAALQPIRLALAAAGRDSVGNLLDFGSGHGRVLRALKAAFPDARLTACDLDPDAVDFCARTFGASPVYSNVDPARIRIDDRFDLIWSGSLFTHIDAPRWPGFLERLASLLAPGGVLVFTTAGRSVAAEMREGAGEHVFTPSGRSVAAEMREGEYRGLTADLARGLVEDFDRTGFGYRDYPGQTGYGHSRAAPSWVCGQVERTAGIELLGYTERGWNGRQDTVACIRRG
jgi:CBS domain-containing protein/SAM-dependent methyltransferase